MQVMFVLIKVLFQDESIFNYVQVTFTRQKTSSVLISFLTNTRRKSWKELFSIDTRFRKESSIINDKYLKINSWP